jgi:uncharacterized protein (TIGR02246 family)
MPKIAQPDLAAIQAVVAMLEKEINSSCSANITTLFAEDADYVSVFGIHNEGRQKIKEGLDVGFLAAKTQMSSTITRVRMLAANVALAYLQSHMSMEGPFASEIHGISSLLLMRDRGAWKIVSLQVTPVGGFPWASIPQSKSGS